MVTAINLPNDATFGNWEDIFYSYYYPSSGGLIRTQRKCVLNYAMTACASPTSLTATETYDSFLRLKKMQQTGSGITRYQRFSYDANNKKTFASFKSANPNETRGQTFTYDSLQRTTSVSSSGMGTVKYKYKANNKIASTDGRGNTAITAYRAFASPSYQLASQILSPENVTTTTIYDAFANIKTITQSGSGKSQTEYRYYDAYNNLCLVKRNDIGNQRSSYNLLGELQWSAQGNINSCNASKPSYAVNYTYDNLGEVQQLLYPDNTPDVTYERDNNGNIAKLQSGSVISEYTYNNLNLLEAETLTTPGIAPLSIDYVYNQKQHISRIVYPNGAQVNFSPNAFGEQSNIYRSGKTYASNITFHPNGMVKSYRYGNSVQHSTLLNALNDLPKQIKATRGTAVISKFDYLYDNNANITRILDGTDSSYNINSLVYDGLDRLTRTYGNAKIGSSTMNYDALGNITYLANKNRTLSYFYNNSLNRLERIDSTGIKAKDYNYFSYDSRGNITHNSHFAMSYNLANQMVAANGNNYLYDGNNRRVKENEKGKLSYSFYSQSGKLLYRQANNVGTNYIYLGNNLIAKDKANTVTYVHTDNLGSPVAETNASGTVVSRMHYLAFGDTLEDAKDDVGYTGHKFDKDLGLSYMQARYYDPVIGRFYSNDPVDAVSHLSTLNGIHGFNRYAYANNNPYRYIDPDGMKSGDPFDNPEKAAEDFGKTHNKESIDTDTELGSSIYSYTDNNGDTKYSYNAPSKGGKTGVTPNPKVENGQTIVSTVHSHAAYKKPSDNKASGNDVDTLIGDNDEFVTTPNGSLVWYNNGKKDGYKTPGQGKVWGVVLPSDKNDPTSRK